MTTSCRIVFSSESFSLKMPLTRYKDILRKSKKAVTHFGIIKSPFCTADPRVWHLKQVRSEVCNTFPELYPYRMIAAYGMRTI